MKDEGGRMKAEAKSQEAKGKTSWGLWLVACGLSLLLVACEVTPSEQFTPQLAVHCLLFAGEPNAQVIVNRTYAIDESADTVVADADVTLRHGNDTWRLPFVGRDLYGRTLRRNILPRDTWHIRVARPGFDTVYGSTIVPDTFTILYPAEGETVNMNDSMGWTRSPNCRGYDIALCAVYPSETYYYDIVLSNDTSGQQFDSLKVHVPKMFFMYGYDPGPFRLPVLALDTNYYDWVSAGGFGPGVGGGDTTYLIGGVGVFGSALMQDLTVYHQPDTTGYRGNGRGQEQDVRMQESEVIDHERNGPGEGTGHATVGSRSLVTPRPASRP